MQAVWLINSVGEYKLYVLSFFYYLTVSVAPSRGGGVGPSVLEHPSTACIPSPRLRQRLLAVVLVRWFFKRIRRSSRKNIFKSFFVHKITHLAYAYTESRFMNNTGLIRKLQPAPKQSCATRGYNRKIKFRIYFWAVRQ